MVQVDERAHTDTDLAIRWMKTDELKASPRVLGMPWTGGEAMLGRAVLRVSRSQPTLTLIAWRSIQA